MKIKGNKARRFLGIENAEDLLTALQVEELSGISTDSIDQTFN